MNFQTSDHGLGDLVLRIQVVETVWSQKMPHFPIRCTKWITPMFFWHFIGHEFSPFFPFYHGTGFGRVGLNTLRTRGLHSGGGSPGYTMLGTRGTTVALEANTVLSSKGTVRARFAVAGGAASAQQAAPVVPDEALREPAFGG